MAEGRWKREEDARTRRGERTCVDGCAGGNESARGSEKVLINKEGSAKQSTKRNMGNFDALLRPHGPLRKGPKPHQLRGGK